jgi:hypothetical protein
VTRWIGRPGLRGGSVARPHTLLAPAHHRPVTDGGCGWSQPRICSGVLCAQIGHRALFRISAKRGTVFMAIRQRGPAPRSAPSGRWVASMLRGQIGISVDTRAGRSDGSEALHDGPRGCLGRRVQTSSTAARLFLPAQHDLENEDPAAEAAGSGSSMSESVRKKRNPRCPKATRVLVVRESGAACASCDQVPSLPHIAQSKVTPSLIPATSPASLYQMLIEQVQVASM